MNRTSGNCSMREPAYTGRGMEDLWNQFFAPSQGVAAGGLSPRVNIAETDQAFELSMGLPGMTAEEIQIEYHENVLTISGERKPEAERPDVRWHRMEQRYGKFQRSFRMTEVDSDRISADFRNGELLVRIPKVPAAVARKIQVNAAPAQE